MLTCESPFAFRFRVRMGACAVCALALRLQESPRPVLRCRPTARRMMEGILVVEEEHADELADLLVAVPEASAGKRRSTKSK